MSTAVEKAVQFCEMMAENESNHQSVIDRHCDEFVQVPQPVLYELASVRQAHIVFIFVKTSPLILMSIVCISSVSVELQALTSHR